MRIRNLFLLLILLALPLFATSSHHASTHLRSTTAKADKPSPSEKTVHVRAYTTKSGKHVKAYDRRPPNTKPKK